MAFKNLWKDTIKTDLVPFRILWLCNSTYHQEDLSPRERSNKRIFIKKPKRWYILMEPNKVYCSAIQSIVNEIVIPSNEIKMKLINKSDSKLISCLKSNARWTFYLYFSRLDFKVRSLIPGVSVKPDENPSTATPYLDKIEKSKFTTGFVVYVREHKASSERQVSDFENLTIFFSVLH